MTYFDYRDNYPNIEKALREGAKLVAYNRGGVRFVVIWDPKNEKSLSQGQYPWISGALLYAEEDFGLSEEEIRQKRPYFNEGKPSRPYDIIDKYLSRVSGFTVVYTPKDLFLCYLSSHPWGSGREEEEVYWDVSTTMMDAISSAILSKGTKIKKELIEFFGAEL